MPTEQVGKYEIEYEACPLPDDNGWAAYVTIFGHSDNPAHRNNIIPRQRVGLEQIFDNETTALETAHQIGMTMLA